MSYVPSQGDIIWLNFDPSSGREIMKHRPAFVLSPYAFNQHTKMAIVAPITSRIRNIKLEVILPKSMQTKGAILVYQLKTIDFVERQATFIEKSSALLIQQVSQIAKSLIS